MELIKKFNTREEYNAYKLGGDYKALNICIIGDEDIEYNGNDPFWIEALEDLYVTFSKKMSYSFDKIEWVTVSPSYNNSPKVLVRTGQKLYIHSTESTINNSGFSSDGKVNIGGNILSLEFGSEYINYSRFPTDRSYSLDLTTLTKIVNAYALIVVNSITIIFKSAYLENSPRISSGSTFKFTNCSSLKYAPIIRSDCNYNSITFQGCSQLSYLKYMPIDWSTGSWLGLASEGTFVLNAKLNSLPSCFKIDGWTTYLYDEEKYRYVTKFQIESIPYEMYTDDQRRSTWEEFIASAQNTNGYYIENDRIYKSEKYITHDDAGTPVKPSDTIWLFKNYTLV